MYIFERFENVRSKGEQNTGPPYHVSNQTVSTLDNFPLENSHSFQLPHSQLPQPKKLKGIARGGDFSRVGIAQWHFFLGVIVLWYLSWNSFTLPSSSLLPMQQLKTSMGTKHMLNSLFKLSRLPVVSLKYILVKKICSLKYN